MFTVWRSVPFQHRQTHRPRIAVLTAVTLGSGLLNLYSLLHPAVTARVRLLRSVFPLTFVSFSRVATLAIGFGLVMSSVNIFKRKSRAFTTVLCLAIGSIVFHLSKGIDYEEAAVSLLLVVMLVSARDAFTVRSSTPHWRAVVRRLIGAASITIAYGVAGFWLLDARHFGIDFSLREAIRQTLLFLALVPNRALTPHTRYAAWFHHSLSWITVIAVVYAAWTLFRPVGYRLRTLPLERARARRLLVRYGRSALDYFKASKDKSLFFSSTGESVLAYRVAGSFAVVLADPVGPEREMPGIIAEFAALCADNDWRLAFYQTLPDLLPIYRQLGFKKLKAGDDAIVDLRAFTLRGGRGRSLRSSLHKIERLGIRAELFAPPLSGDLLNRLQDVAEAWQRIPGRRERQFALGQWEPDYVRDTPVFAALDSHDRVIAFVNIVPSYRQRESTIDLMRRMPGAPNGVMDYILIKLFERSREDGFERFNLGMAPMCGFSESEEASPEERTVHAFVQRLDFIFSYRGIRSYKAKFATEWEPRYVIYRTELDLPRLGVALARISER